MTLQIAPGFSFGNRKQFIVYGGGKGGGGSAPTQTTSTVNQSNLPEYARPYYESLMQRAQATSNDPYQAYTGQRIAPLTQDQNQAISTVRNNTGSYQPFFDQASQGIQQAGNFNPAQVQNTYSAQNYTPQNWIDPNVANQYMSPYMQGVVDIGKREANRDYNIQQQGRDAKAVQSGAFGGYRDAIVNAEANRNLNQQLQDLQTRGMQDAYQTGLGAFNSDRQANFAATGLNAQNQQTQSQMGMSATNANNQTGMANAQLGLSAGQAMAGLGQATQQAGIADAQALLNTGAVEQAQQQQGFDTAYADFVNQRDYGRNNLNWLSGILRGVPTSPNTTTTGYQAPPSMVSQISGLGLGAAGLAKLLG